MFDLFFFHLRTIRISVVHNPLMLSSSAGVPEAGADGGVRERGHRGRPQMTRRGAEAADTLIFAL